MPDPTTPELTPARQPEGSPRSTGAEKIDLKKMPRQRTAVAGTVQLIDRLPPHSPEAEQAVLGCILLSPNDCMGEFLARLKSSEVFYDLRHQALFDLMAEMFDKREAIDLVTLNERLKDKKISDAVGGIAYVADLPDKVPSVAHLTWYLNIVQEKFLLRRMIKVCTEAVGSAYDYEGEFDELMDGIETAVLQISESRVQTSTIPIKDLVKSAITTIEDYHSRQGALTGIGTGFVDLDKLTTGLHGGEMIVIAARPSVGKTSLAMNIAEYVAIDERLPVGIFSLEMTAESLILRMLCSRSRVNLRNVREGFLAERDFPKLTGAATKLSGAPLFIDDSSGLSILQLRAKARRMYQQYGIKLFVIDYLQLVHSTARRADNRQQEIADISSGIKALAKELNVPVIVLSQLNREVEREKGRPPRLSDLRESGAIEQDADLVGLLYRPTKDGDDSATDQARSEAEPINLLIAKQRNGPADEDVCLTFLKPYTRFESAAKIQAADVQA